MSARIAELATLVGGHVLNDGQVTVNGAQSMTDATADDVTFAVNEQNLSLLAESAAGAAIIPRDLSASDRVAKLSIPLILVDDPLGAFCLVMQHFRPPRPRAQVGVSPRAEVDTTAEIGSGTNVHPGAYIGPETQIGNDCEIHPGVVIGAGCRIGDGCVLHPNTVLYDGVQLGKRVIVHAAAVLGADGFGYQFKDGEFVKIPQLGIVVIGDDVEIGACTTIDRAMIGATTVGRGCKLDNQIMIGHNCQLGEHNVFASQVGLAGSVTTEAYVMCAGQVGIADHVTIGKGAKLASKTGVHKSLAGGQNYIGQPARPEREGIKTIIATTKLPQMVSKFRKMQADVAELTKRLDELSEDFPLAKAG